MSGICSAGRVARHDERAPPKLHLAMPAGELEPEPAGHGIARCVADVAMDLGERDIGEGGGRSEKRLRSASDEPAPGDGGVEPVTQLDAVRLLELHTRPGVAGKETHPAEYAVVLRVAKGISKRSARGEVRRELLQPLDELRQRRRRVHLLGDPSLQVLLIGEQHRTQKFGIFAAPRAKDESFRAQLAWHRHLHLRDRQPSPTPPIGVVSTRLLKPAMSGRPFAMAACTAGICSDARWLS